MNHSELTNQYVSETYSPLSIEPGMSLTNLDEGIRNQINDSFVSLLTLVENLSRIFILPDEFKKEIMSHSQIPIDKQSSLLLDSFNTSSERMQKLSFYLQNLHIVISSQI